MSQDQKLQLISFSKSETDDSYVMISNDHILIFLHLSYRL